MTYYKLIITDKNSGKNYTIIRKTRYEIIRFIDEFEETKKEGSYYFDIHWIIYYTMRC